MDEKPCVFCGIISGSVPSKIVYEDEFTMAFLDRFPRSRGMVIVAPKQHYKEFDDNLSATQKVLYSVLVVSEMVKQALNPKNVSVSIIPSDEVPHFHVRVYPVYEEEQPPLMENRPLEVTEDELDRLAEKIRGIKVEIKRDEPEPKKEEPMQEEKKQEPGRSKEDIYYIKRSLDIG
jgi:histidine triad (HIT) family protein